MPAAGLPVGHLAGLDALRAVAVMLVIVYHFGFQWVPGGYGVVLFFVLSGFLISHLLLAERDRFGNFSLKQFYLRRCLRIFPAFYLYWFVLVGALLLTGRSVPWGHAWSSFFYLSDYYIAVLGDPNTGFSHTWSLAIEEQFYLLWPLTLLLLGRRSARFTKLLFLAIVGIWLYRLVLRFGLGVSQAYLYAAFEARADALLAGCLLAVVVNRKAFAGFFHSVTGHAAFPLLTLACLALVIVPQAFFGTAWRDSVGHALAPPLFAVLIVQMMHLGGVGAWSWIELPAVRYLGKISYSLYLWQQLTVPLGARLAGSASRAVQLSSAVALTILVAALSYHLVELPFLRLKQRFGYRKPEPSPG